MYKSGKQLSTQSIFIWRIIQTLFWFIGVSIFTSLLFFPSIGLLVFWNILIPVAPALFVVATGLWRNICPLATTILLTRHFNLSQKKKMTARTQAKLQLVAILALFVIVPLRHPLFNNNGLATAVLLFLVTITGLIMGFFYDWKSGWCASLCPVHPVEKLYGSNTLLSFPNAHCEECVNCSIPCPDSTPNIHPGLAKKTIYHKLSSCLTIGALPGFIWGWFQVPDHIGAIGQVYFFEMYSAPFLGATITITLYFLLQKYVTKKNNRFLISAFAAAGVSCYYWYRIPALLGFGEPSNDGLLINLKNVFPEWAINLLIISTTIFFFSWFLFRKPNHKSWIVRPEFALQKT